MNLFQTRVSYVEQISNNELLIRAIEDGVLPDVFKQQKTHEIPLFSSVSRNFPRLFERNSSSAREKLARKVDSQVDLSAWQVK